MFFGSIGKILLTSWSIYSLNDLHCTSSSSLGEVLNKTK
jgi:hypothetical protein